MLCLGIVHIVHISASFVLHAWSFGANASFVFKISSTQSHIFKSVQGIFSWRSLQDCHIRIRAHPVSTPSQLTLSSQSVPSCDWSY